MGDVVSDQRIKPVNLEFGVRSPTITLLQDRVLTST